MFVLICEHVFVVFVLILGVCLSEMRLLFSFGTFDSFLAGHPKIVYMVHVALTKMSINQFKPVQQIRQQTLEHTVLLYLLLGQYTSEKILNIQWPTFLQLLIFGSSFCLGSKINYYKWYKHMVNYCIIPSKEKITNILNVKSRIAISV